MSVGELKRMNPVSVATVIQCSGNGRKFSEHGPSGSQWATGAAACVMWTGVRVADVVATLGGINAAAKFMTSTGGEVLPEGIDRLTAVVERSVLKEKGLKDCILAWEMNGAPVPLSHGGPVRLIVPGYYGCNNIKYIKKLAFTEVETQAKIQKSGYRFRPIGQKGNPSYPSMWRMNVKSWLNGPGADEQPVLHGKVRFYGVALSGERGVNKVEYSTDGAAWKEATFTSPDLGENAWRTFGFELDLKPGKHTLFTRATDSKGDVQPEKREENERGYGNNSWRDHALTISVVSKLPEKKKGTNKAGTPTATTEQKKVKLSEQGQRGRKLFVEEAQPPCGACHTVSEAGTKGAVGPNLDQLKPSTEQVSNAVNNGVGVMPSFGDKLSKEQVADIATYIKEATK